MTLDYPNWKKAIIFVVLLFGLLYALPNIYLQDPAVQISASRNAVLDAATKEKIEGDLQGAKIAFKSVELSDKRMLVRLVDRASQSNAADLLRKSLGENYTVALNLASTVPDWLSMFGAKPMTLGLDLQGGVHFLLEVDRKAVIDAADERLVDEIKTALRTKNIRGTASRASDGVLVTLRSEEDRKKAATEIANFAIGVQIVDVPGSLNAFPLSIKVPGESRIAAMDQVIEQNLSTLRNRINAIGIAEPSIQRQGTSRIAVQLPGVQDTAAAKKILGATATLEYRLANPDTSLAFEAAQSGRAPAGYKLYVHRDGRPVLLSRRLIAQGDEIVTATSTLDRDSGTPAVSIVMNDAGGRKMYQVTEQNVNRPLAVVFVERIPELTVVDGKEVRTSRTREEVISLANIAEPFGKHFQTTGLERTEADELALLLRAGSLSAPIDIVEERVIGPSLGADNIRAGVLAVTYSFLFVLAFFVIYYKTFGVVTNLAVLLNLLLVVAVMSLFGATLTLPGLAGIALTIGMSVDANVLINERIREELRAGTSPLASIGIGYEKASGTILDANITALLGGIALFSFGSGPIRGFALSLCVGILTSMYTAVSASRGIASLFYSGRKKLARLSI